MNICVFLFFLLYNLKYVHYNHYYDYDLYLTGSCTVSFVCTTVVLLSLLNKLSNLFK